MTKRKLSIGIQTFRKIREEDCYYVDNTAYARRLVDEYDRSILDALSPKCVCSPVSTI